MLPPRDVTDPGPVVVFPRTLGVVLLITEPGFVDVGPPNKEPPVPVGAALDPFAVETPKVLNGGGFFFGVAPDNPSTAG